MNIASLDPHNLALSARERLRINSNCRKPPRHAPGEKFLKGPVPWKWLAAAARLPGRTLHVAIAIWLEAGIKANCEVSLRRGTLDELGLDRFAMNRGIRKLETAGLISVKRARGKKFIITLNDVNVSNLEC